MLTRYELLDRYRDAGGRIPLLGLVEFFDGNEQEDSLAPNQAGEGRPGLAEIARRLRELEAHPDVAWVRVQLHEETFDDAAEWIAAEGIAIATRLDEAAVDALLDVEELQAEGTFEGLVYGEEEFAELPETPEGHRVLSLVWD